MPKEAVSSEENRAGFSFHTDALVTWQEARDRCKIYGGDLATIDSEKEQGILEKNEHVYNNKCHGMYHIGLKTNEKPDISL